LRKSERNECEENEDFVHDGNVKSTLGCDSSQ
jgi:hypothetical protein